MGNVTIDTDFTKVYYPSEWLIEGGPPYGTMDCPDFNEAALSMTEPLSIVRTQGGENGLPWKVIMEGRVMMECVDPKDAANYVEGYMHELDAWVARQH